MRSSIAALSVVFVATSVFSLPKLAIAKPVPINGFAAKVNGRVITKSELNESIKFAQMRLRYVRPSAEKTKLVKNLRKDTLEGLIERELLLSEFKKRGGQVKPEMIDDEINRIIREKPYLNDRSKFLADLKKQGTTIAKFRELQEKSIAVRYMRSTQLTDIPVATPTEIKKYYDDNPTKFRDAGFIRLRTITLPKKGADGDAEAAAKLAKEIHTKLVNGSDFGTLAKTYSIDSAAANGGDRGTIGPDTQDLRKDLVDLAFMQPTGSISQLHQDLGETGFYYIMKVESRKLGKRSPLSDPQVKKKIEKAIREKKRSEALDRWLERLKQEAIIKRY